MSFSRIILQLLPTLTTLSKFSQISDMTSSTSIHDPRQTSPEGSDGNHNHTFPFRRERNHVRASLLIKFYKVLPWANHGFQLSSDYWGNPTQSDHIKDITTCYRLATRLFTFILCFFQTHHPPYITQTPGWWPPQEVSLGIYWKYGLIPKKRGSPKCQCSLTPFWLTTDQSQILCTKTWLQVAAFYWHFSTSKNR